MKRVLQEAGLGEKKLTLLKNKDPAYLRDALCEHYPKLQEGGGFELLRSASRVTLDIIKMPASGYTTHFLSDESGIATAICYIRPLQTNLSLDAVGNCEVSFSFFFTKVLFQISLLVVVLRSLRTGGEITLV